MKRLTNILHSFLLFAVIVCSILFLSCAGNDDIPDKNETTEQTIFMYLPWSGSDIYSYFLKNISSFETAIKDNKGTSGSNFIVFIAPKSTKAYLIDISYEKGNCIRDTLKEYSFSTPSYTTAEGIASILSDVRTSSKANSYSMIIGCHGMGWLPAGTEVMKAYSKMKMAAKDIQLTRYFGDASDSRYQTDIKSLANGIEQTGIKMKFILFDDCYMSNIETAYALRNATDYLIASTSEIMIEGMPYANIGIDLINHDYPKVCDKFYAYYSAYKRPCGTIAVTDCDEIEHTAQLMKEINAEYPKGVEDVSDIQTLDGITPSIFFDFGDYVRHLIKDESLYSALSSQLELLVPYKAATKTYYSSITGKEKEISSYSGLTVSDPSSNQYIMSSKKKTDWYEATH